MTEIFSGFLFAEHHLLFHKRTVVSIIICDIFGLAGLSPVVSGHDSTTLDVVHDQIKLIVIGIVDNFI